MSVVVLWLRLHGRRGRSTLTTLTCYRLTSDQLMEYLGVAARVVSHARARFLAKGVPRNADVAVVRALSTKAGVQRYMESLESWPLADVVRDLVSLTLFTLSRESCSQKWMQIVAGR